MIELVSDLPEGVVGFTASGRITEDDYKDVLIPTLKTALEKGDARVLCVFETGIAQMAPGAMWDDFTFGVTHWSGWKRIALVTDDDGIRSATRMLSWLMPGEVRAYPAAERPVAEAWLAS